MTTKRPPPPPARDTLKRIARDAQSTLRELPGHLEALDAIRDQLSPEELDRAFHSALANVCRDADQKRARIREALTRRNED